MTSFRRTVPRSILPLFLVFAAGSAVTLAADLSTYRDFHLGADLTTIAKQAGANPSQAKVIHRRPALIQELEWRPQSLGPSSQREAAEKVVFSFFDGELFRIVVDYDRHETEGLTVDDLVDAISSTYGPAARLVAPARLFPESYEDRGEILAQWHDSQHRFDLIRSSYGPAFRLLGVTERLETSAQTATLEARRLDDQEAPERDAARLVNEEQVAKVKLEKARLLNKPKFRP
jgi:hypothetical protein